MSITLTSHQQNQRKIEQLEDAIDREDQLRNPDRQSIATMLEEINVLEHELGARA